MVAHWLQGSPWAAACEPRHIRRAHRLHRRFIIVVSQWRGIFSLYKQRALALRRGEYFFDRHGYDQMKANRFLGYQVIRQRTCCPTTAHEA